MTNSVTDGNANVTLEAKNLPPHRHTIYGSWQDSSGKTNNTGIFLYSKWNIVFTARRIECSENSDEISVSSLFGILPLYITCYTWYRTS